MTLNFEHDRPLAAASGDRLGLGATAARLTTVIGDGTTPTGSVIGVTGRWGSGKSSMVGLIRANVAASDPDASPELVDFAPWLIGDRDRLMGALFEELANAVDRIELAGGDATGMTVRAAQRAGKQMKRFAARLSVVGKATKVAGPIYYAMPVVGGVMEAIADWASKERKLSMENWKRRLSTRLQRMPRGVLVVIDDLDRLEPAEVLEVLRLVRSVADFPNVTYLLCYDPDVVAHAVSTAAGIADGHAFIEKIVQITIPVPVPEAFDLRRWFRSELATIAAQTGEETERRLAEVVDIEGGRYLVTPRSVVRTVASLRFHWLAVDGNLDFADLVWLDLVKTGNPHLHAWAVRYVAEASVQSSGRARVSEDAATADRKALDAALAREGLAFAQAAPRLSELLPGFDYVQETGEGPGIHKDVHQDEVEQAVRDGRLASPDHYRLYSAFVVPLNAPATRDYQLLGEALDVSPDAAWELFEGWTKLTLTNGASKADTLLERLAAGGGVELDAERAERLLRMMGDHADKMSMEEVGFGGPEAWRTAWRLTRRMLPLLAGRRREAVRSMFRNGSAMGWLTFAFRDQIFAYGRNGVRRSGTQVLEPEELDDVTEEMLSRYRALGFEGILQLPRPVSALFAWMQGGDAEEPRNAIAVAFKSDEGLIRVLDSLSSRISVSVRRRNQEMLTLSRDNLEHFFDFDAARERVRGIAVGNEDEGLRNHARKLLDRFDAGTRF